MTQVAQDELKDLLQENLDALQFYGKKYGDKSLEGTVEVVTECIRQVFAVDVRSSYQTKKAREGKFQAKRSARIEDNDANPNANLNATQHAVPDNGCDGTGTSTGTSNCTQQLDNLLIEYTVTVTEAADRQNSQCKGSGAEDVVFVQSI
jgi:hypothetical protein